MSEKSCAKKAVVIHYAEIGLKGKNRPYFENLLMRNIQRKLKGQLSGIEEERGYIWLVLSPEAVPEKIHEVLVKMPGVSSFSFAMALPHDLEMLKAEAVLYLETYRNSYESFAVHTKRSDKNFPKTSVEINILLGKLIQETFHKKVNLEKPDLVLKVEITQRRFFISAQSIAGVGGLPTDTNQEVLTLLSGGFDSPVAAYLMIKRGCQSRLVHFINTTQESTSVQNKVVQIAKALANYQNKTVLHLVPFEEIQRRIIMKVHSTLRMLVYRRLMLRMATKIAYKEGSQFLVVGDNLSQVASQTIENLAATYQGLKMGVLSPLIGFNKEEIMDLARKIGTYQISKLPYDDCCSFFLPKHPALKSSAEMLNESEELVAADPLVLEALQAMVTHEF